MLEIISFQRATNDPGTEMNLKTLGLEDSHVKCIMFMERMLAEFFSVEPHNGAPGAPTVLYMRDIFRTLSV